MDGKWEERTFVSPVHMLLYRLGKILLQVPGSQLMVLSRGVT